MGLNTQPTTALVGDDHTYKVLRISGLRGTTRYLVKEHIFIYSKPNILPTVARIPGVENTVNSCNKILKAVGSTKCATNRFFYCFQMQKA